MSSLKMHVEAAVFCKSERDTNPNFTEPVFSRSQQLGESPVLCHKLRASIFQVNQLLEGLKKGRSQRAQGVMMVITRRVSNGQKRTTGATPRKMLIRGDLGRRGRGVGIWDHTVNHERRNCRYCLGVPAFAGTYNSVVYGNDSSSHSPEGGRGTTDWQPSNA